MRNSTILKMKRLQEEIDALKRAYQSNEYVTDLEQKDGRYLYGMMLQKREKLELIMTNADVTEIAKRLNLKEIINELYTDNLLSVEHKALFLNNL